MFRPESLASCSCSDTSVTFYITTPAYALKKIDFDHIRTCTVLVC